MPITKTYLSLKIKICICLSSALLHSMRSHFWMRSICLIDITVCGKVNLPAACLHPDCITADNVHETLQRSCCTAADLPAEHTDLHIEEEEGEEEEMEALPPFVLFSFSLSASLHRLPAWKWHCCNPSSCSSTSPSLFLHLWSPEGFVSVCSCQMPALCRPPSLPVCVYDRERVMGFLGSLFIQAGGVLSHCLCKWCVCVCACVYVCVHVCVPVCYCSQRLLECCWMVVVSAQMPSSIVCLCYFHLCTVHFCLSYMWVPCLTVTLPLCSELWAYCLHVNKDFSIWKATYLDLKPNIKPKLY